MRPIQFNVYKGIKGTNGALQFNLLLPSYTCSNCRLYVRPGHPNFATCDESFKPLTCWKCKNGSIEPKDGRILVEAASTVGQNVYDWANKHVFAMTALECASLLLAINTGEIAKSDGKKSGVTFLHDPGTQTDRAGKFIKTLNFYSPRGPAAGCLVKSLEKKNGTTTIHSVPLLGTELKALCVLLERAIPMMMSW